MQVRVGQGFDVHPFVDDASRPLVLGGVTFESERALRGHSDADVIAHACTDALLGAAGLGDIGQHFPDTDPAWAGADSIGLLAEATRRVRDAGWEPGNVDASVVTDHPKLAPAREEMQAKLSGAVASFSASIAGASGPASASTASIHAPTVAFSPSGRSTCTARP